MPVSRRRDDLIDDATATASSCVLRFGATGWTIALHGCPDVADGLLQILHGWKPEILSERAPDVDASVTALGGRYVWVSANRTRPKLWDDVPPTSAMNVISDIHDAFIDWHLSDHPEQLCLHTAAISTADGLVCFPSGRKAGKSTLCADLIAAGALFVCDDVLPVDTRLGQGTALGLAPMLRRPLPANAGKRLRAFVADRAGPGHDRWMYLRLGSPEILPYGSREPACALVLLDRRSGAAAAELEPVAKGDMLAELILQNFAREDVPGIVLDTLAAVVRGSECLRLRYAAPHAATDLIRRTWA